MWVQSFKKSNPAQNQSGQATIEYILILTLTLSFAIFFAKSLTHTLDTGVLNLGGELERNLKTGRAPVTVFAN